MSKASRRIAQLIIKKFQGTLSEEEKVELDSWTTASPGNVSFMQKRMTPKSIIERLITLSKLDKEAIRKKTWRKIREIEKQEGNKTSDK